MIFILLALCGPPGDIFIDIDKDGKYVLADWVTKDKSRQRYTGWQRTAGETYFYRDYCFRTGLRGEGFTENETWWKVRLSDSERGWMWFHDGQRWVYGLTTSEHKTPGVWHEVEPKVREPFDVKLPGIVNVTKIDAPDIPGSKDGVKMGKPPIHLPKISTDAKEPNP